MAVSFLNNTCYFRGISFGNQREVALAHVHAHAHTLAPLLLQLPLPLPLLSLLISHSIAPLNLKLPQPLSSRPFPCPPRSIEQLILDLVLKNVKQTQQNNKQSKTH